MPMLKHLISIPARRAADGGMGGARPYWAVCLTSAISLCWIFGTSCIAARALDADPLLDAAAFTCISSTLQYPLGSAHAGIGCRAARATAGLASFSAAVST